MSGVLGTKICGEFLTSDSNYLTIKEIIVTLYRITSESLACMDNWRLYISDLSMRMVYQWDTPPSLLI